MTDKEIWVRFAAASLCGINAAGNGLNDNVLRYAAKVVTSGKDYNRYQQMIGTILLGGFGGLVYWALVGRAYKTQ